MLRYEKYIAVIMPSRSIAKEVLREGLIPPLSSWTLFLVVGEIGRWVKYMTNYLLIMARKIFKALAVNPR